MSKLFSTVFILFFIFSAKPGLAFKVDTHVWIAQEVLNDAIDGKISIPMNDRVVEIKLPKRLSTALKENPDFFRLGNIGPDAFPSVYLGQIIIHPGVKGSWGTSDWLMHLCSNQKAMSDKELAFVFGFLCHTAADVFAHTYVNRYTGDVFNILDNTEVAARHIAVEALIAKHTPPLLNSEGKDLGLPGNLSRQINGEPAAPIQYIFDTLLFNHDALGVYKTGKGEHIVLIDKLRSKLDKVLATDGTLEDLENKITKFILEITFEITISEEMAEVARRLAEEIHDITDFSQESAKIHREVAKLMKSLDQKAFNLADKHLKEAQKIEADLAKAINKLSDLEKSIIKKEKEFLKIPEKIEEVYYERILSEVAKRHCLKRYPFDSDKRKKCREDKTETLQRVRMVVNKNRTKALRKIQKMKTDLVDIKQKSIPNLTGNLREALTEASNVVEQFHDARIDAANLLVRYFEGNHGKNPLRRYLENWRQDIDTVMYDYILANANTLIGTMQPKAEDPLDPLKEWFNCRSKGLIGVPVILQDGVCQTVGRYHEISTAFNDLHSKMIAMAPGGKELNRLKKEWEDFLKETKSSLINLAEKEIGQALAGGLGVDLNHIKQHIEGNVDASTVNREFSNDGSGEKLLIIPDAGDRIVLEMHLNDKNHFDSKQYAVARNSVLMAKLALLNNKGLSKLASKAKIKNTLYGKKLWSDKSKYGENILFGFLRSIDGNHQWMCLAPPHPRSNGADWEDFLQRRGEDGAQDSPYRYGYSNWRDGRGMRLWADRGKTEENFPLSKDHKDARNQIFRAIFKGPLVPGIDTPQEIGMDAVLPPEYLSDWVPTKEKPFPDPPEEDFDFPAKESH